MILKCFIIIIYLRSEQLFDLQVFGILARERPMVRAVTFYVMSSNDAAGLAAGQYWTSLPVTKRKCKIAGKLLACKNC